MQEEQIVEELGREDKEETVVSMRNNKNLSHIHLNE